MYVDMETQIHHLEQEAYGAILRAFKAQSDALTWEKESLITELRKELRVSDDEHRDLLTQANADSLIQTIREWRKTMGSQPVHEQLPSPTVSGSRKRPKMSQSVMMPLGAPSELHHQTIATGTQPTTPGARWGAAPGNGGFRPRPGQQVFSSKPVHYQQAGPGSSSAFSSGENAERPRDSLIGRRVMTRWPDDNNFYEAIITDYNAADGRHALLYDGNTPKEAWEWVDLKEIPSADIRWIGDDPGISRGSGVGGPSYGVNAVSSGRGRRFARQQFENDVHASQNGLVQKASDEIEILHTETLLKKVEKVIDASHPDLFEIEKAKKMLKEHEQALIDVIARLADVCDSESGREQPFFLRANRDGGTHGSVEMETEKRTRSTAHDTALGQSTVENQQDEDVIVI